MDAILIMFWFIMALSFFCALISSAYYMHVRGAKDIFAKLIVAFIVYGFSTLGLGFLAGLVLFIGAHANPPGSVLCTRELVIGAGLIIAYAILGWLMCSFIVGRLILPDRSSKDQ